MWSILSRDEKPDVFSDSHLAISVHLPRGSTVFHLEITELSK